MKKVKSLTNTITELEEIKNFGKLFSDSDASFVHLKDENLKYVFVNQALRDFYNLPYDKIIGHDDFMILEPELLKWSGRGTMRHWNKIN
ncbi:MAG: PAS domain-containing protein [Muricomes sp.]